MKINNRLIIAAGILTFCTPLIDSNAWLFALQDKATKPPAQTKKAVDPSVELNAHIRELTKEIRELHVSQRQMLSVMLLQIEQQRAEKLEEKLAVLESQSRTLLSREADLEQRLGNIEGELTARNILNRQEGERVVRAELQSSLDQVRAERTRVDGELQRLRDQVDTLNRRLDLIREKLGPALLDAESPEQPDKATEPSDTQ